MSAGPSIWDAGDAVARESLRAWLRNKFRENPRTFALFTEDGVSFVSVDALAGSPLPPTPGQLPLGQRWTFDARTTMKWRTFDMNGAES